MKADQQSSPELSHLCKLIAHTSIATLTIIDATGAAVNHPVVPLEMDEQGVLWIFADLRDAQAEDLQAVSVCFADPLRPAYIELSGWMEIRLDRVPVEQLRRHIAKSGEEAVPATAHMTLLKFITNIAAYWDAPLCKMVRLVIGDSPRLPADFAPLPRRVAQAAAQWAAAVAGRGPAAWR